MRMLVCRGKLNSSRNTFGLLCNIPEKCRVTKQAIVTQHYVFWPQYIMVEIESTSERSLGRSATL
jgi:hypothetical protein